MASESSSNWLIIAVGAIILIVLLGGVFVLFLGGSALAPSVAVGPPTVGSSSTSASGSPTTATTGPAVEVRLVADPTQPGKVKHIEFDGNTYFFDEVGLIAFRGAAWKMAQTSNDSFNIVADDGIDSAAVEKVNAVLMGQDEGIPTPVGAAPATE